MAVQEQKQPQLNISSDGMEAYLRLPVPSLGEPYTEDKILQFLSEKGVCVGIQKEAIKGLLDAGIYERDVRVAVGTKPVDGTDGYYEYEFNSDFSKKPKIREDGTVLLATDCKVTSRSRPSRFCLHSGTPLTRALLSASGWRVCTPHLRVLGAAVLWAAHGHSTSRASVLLGERPVVSLLLRSLPQ